MSPMFWVPCYRFRRSRNARTRQVRTYWWTGVRRCRTSPVGCSGARRRFLCPVGAQDVRPDRHRGVVGTTRTAGGHATLSRWRRDDRLGQLRADDLQGASAPLRGRNASDHRGDRIFGRLRLSYRLGLDRVVAHERALRAMRSSAWKRVPGVRVLAGRRCPSDGAGRHHLFRH